MAISSTKDVIYSAFFSLMVMHFSKIIQNETIVYNKIFNISFVSVAFGQMIFRNQGKYVFWITICCTLIICRKLWKRLLILFLSTTVLFSLYSGPITSLCGAYKEKSNIKEMLSVPCTQLAKASIDNIDELTLDEKELIDIYIPTHKSYYDFIGNADNMKNNLNTDLLREHPIEFIQLWISVGLKAPRAYIDAWARLSIGLWYPDMDYCDPAAWHPYWEYRSTPMSFQEQGYVVVDRKTPIFMQWLANFYEKITYENIYQNIPILSIIFSSGILFWLLLIYIASCIYYKKYKLLVPASAILALWLTLMLGPVVLYRYTYPIVMSVPILFTVLITEHYNS